MRRIINGLKAEGFGEGEYDVVRNNCNHFCDEFAFALVGKRIPSWVNRAATIGSWAGLGEVGRGLWAVFFAYGGIMSCIACTCTNACTHEVWSERSRCVVDLWARPLNN